MQYKLMNDSIDIIQKDTNGVVSCVPACPGNRDWDVYQLWLDDGNTPLAADADWN